MNENELIKSFFDITEQLSFKNITKSSRYLGDIAEYICEREFKIKLCDSLRHPNVDAFDIESNKISYQIKINNSIKKTNQNVGNKDKYDFLLLLVTQQSKMYNKAINKNAFILVYEIKSTDIPSNSKYIAKKFIDTLQPKIILDKNINTIKS